MDIEKELQQKYAELEGIRASINKVLSNAHVESYSATGNSITYREMNDLRTEESRLMFTINQLELIKKGQRVSGIVTTSFRVR